MSSLQTTTPSWLIWMESTLSHHLDSLLEKEKSYFYWKTRALVNILADIRLRVGMWSLFRTQNVVEEANDGSLNVKYLGLICPVQEHMCGFPAASKWTDKRGNCYCSCLTVFWGVCHYTCMSSWYHWCGCIMRYFQTSQLVLLIVLE